MARTAKPVSAAERKAIGQKLKDARAAKRAERDALVAENAALKAALASGPATFAAGTVVPITGTLTAIDLAKRKETPNESRDFAPPTPKDDLDWIDGHVNAVYLVSKNMTITLRPVNPDVHPIVQGVSIHAFDRGPWEANPYEMRSRSEDHETRAAEEKLNAVKFAEWGYFAISRQLAESVYGDPRHPVPTEAIVSGAEFRGYDRNVRRSQGTYRPLGPTPDVLRECVRSVLQRLDHTYIDASRHYDAVASMRFDARVPNPYRRGLGGLSLKAPAVPLQREGMTK